MEVSSHSTPGENWKIISTLLIKILEQLNSAASFKKEVFFDESHVLKLFQCLESVPFKIALKHFVKKVKEADANSAVKLSATNTN